LSLVLKALTKADILNKRRFASISIKNCFADVKENDDLFWAIRGGGGNFGIVTSFLFRGCPVDQVFAGPMLWEMEHARELLKWYRGISLALPEELYGFFAFLTHFLFSSLCKHLVKSGLNRFQISGIWLQAATSAL
jgi:hypothetical protein